jgi:hypothetical protein
MFEILGQTSIRNLQNLLKQYGLTKTILAYVEDKRSNTNTIKNVLKLIIDQLWKWKYISPFRNIMFKKIL